MSRLTFLLIGFAALMAFDTFSQVCFKLTALQAAPFEIDADWLWRVVTGGWVYGAVMGYVGAFVTWMTLLRAAPVGPAFAASHLEIVGVMAISAPLFGEVVTTRQLIGAGLVIAGVIALAFGETSDPDGRH